MFEHCKNEYEAGKIAVTLLFGQNYLDQLDDASYLLLMRQAKFMFDCGKHWKEEQIRRQEKDKK